MIRTKKSHLKAQFVENQPALSGIQWFWLQLQVRVDGISMIWEHEQNKCSQYIAAGGRYQVRKPERLEVAVWVMKTELLTRTSHWQRVRNHLTAHACSAALNCFTPVTKNSASFWFTSPRARPVRGGLPRQGLRIKSLKTECGILVGLDPDWRLFQWEEATDLGRLYSVMSVWSQSTASIAPD